MVNLNNETLTIIIEDELTIYQVENIKKEILKNFDSVNKVSININEVTKIDSAGFQLLVSLKQTCKTLNKDFIVSDLSNQTIKFLQLFGCANYLAKGQDG
ncbi:MAG: hypothetical protein RL154_1540 [Pseudomonadota bacterium]|jgi:anti-anti-sigma factor